MRLTLINGYPWVRKGPKQVLYSSTTPTKHSKRRVLRLATPGEKRAYQRGYQKAYAKYLKLKKTITN